MDADRFDVEAIYCLGDVIGYGPDPIPCLQHAKNWHVVLRGNHEDAALSDDDLPGWIAVVHARKTILRFRSQLAQHPQQRAISAFLAERPTHLLIENALYVHGSPRDHVNEYLFPEDVYNDRKMAVIGSLFDKLCFFGHTHIPGVFRRTTSSWEHVTPEECGYEYVDLEDKLICNVGSVGQPRDGDARACYVLFTPDRIIFRRVDYDVDLTIKKMCDNGDDDFHSGRLNDGR